MVKVESDLLGGVIDVKDLTKVLIIVAFDVPSEGKKHISEKEHDFLQALRRTFANNLYDLGCQPIQQSMFRVPTTIPPDVQRRYPYITNVGIVEEVQRRVANFKQKYATGWTDPETGLTKSYLKSTRMEVLPVAMSSEGYDVFVGMQVDGLYAWISSQLELYEKSMDEKEATQGMIDRWKRDINSIEDAITVFFGPGATDYTEERYDNLKGDLEMLQNTYQEVLDTVKIVEKLTSKKKK